MSDTLPIQKTLADRFGVCRGTPSNWSTSGDHVVYTPATGKRARLKWLSLYSDPDNTAKCIVLVKWDGASGEIYNPVFPAGLGVFQHASVREGAVNEKVLINLSANQTIYVAGLDAEDF